MKYASGINIKKKTGKITMNGKVTTINAISINAISMNAISMNGMVLLISNNINCDDV